MIESPLPHGRTARRVEWTFLPPHIRSLVEQRCGSPVVEAISQGGGFTPGFASVLVCEDGSRHFVKAASTKAQRMFAHSYREEARKLRGLPAGAPAAPLRWFHDGEDWVVLGLAYVEGRAPRRPWTQADLDASIAMLERSARVLTPAPAGMALDPFAVEFADFPGHWDHVRATRPGLAHQEEGAALAARFVEVTAGDTVVHTDVRDDNILIRPDGSAVLCDWNWPAVGAAWLDTVFLMIGPRGDGLDVEAALASATLTKDLPAEHVDIVLALLAAFFMRQSDEPVPPTSPHLRDVQWWQGEVVWDWLCERRGWE
ncbi:hypothetical protein [Nocardioides sp.]|uniref:phosphotransferase family protein n=1 Tax=Nocardioides sp. TaxID=35761 RepID=UPI00286A988E|nr:hypothetical protein [Nocardioides sp.]